MDVFWFAIGLLIVLLAAIFTVNTRGGGSWTFIPFVSKSRNDLNEQEYLAESELARQADEQKAKDVAP